MSDGTAIPAAQKLQNVNTGMYAKDVKDNTSSASATSPKKGVIEPCAKRPRYTRGLLWDDNDNI